MENFQSTKILLTLLLMELYGVPIPVLAAAHEQLYGVSMADRRCFRICLQNSDNSSRNTSGPFDLKCKDAFSSNQIQLILTCNETCKNCPKYCVKGDLVCPSPESVYQEIPHNCYLFCKNHRPPHNESKTAPPYETTCDKVDDSQTCRETCASCPEYCWNGSYSCPDSSKLSHEEWKTVRKEQAKSKRKFMFIIIGIVLGTCCFCGLGLCILIARCRRRNRRVEDQQYHAPVTLAQPHTVSSDTSIT